MNGCEDFSDNKVAILPVGWKGYAFTGPGEGREQDWFYGEVVAHHVDGGVIFEAQGINGWRRFQDYGSDRFRQTLTKESVEIMGDVKVVDVLTPTEFEKDCNELLAQGYTLSSSSSGVVNSEAYDFCSYFHAIFVKQENKV